MSEPVQPVDPLIGALLHGKYRLVRRIGSGGFGTVYEASDERGAGNRVAVKLLNKEFSSDARLVRAFRAEARRMTRLSHPNIVDWKNFDVDENGLCYFVMELVEGEELDRVLERDRPLAPERAARILLQMLDALRTAHHLAEGGSVLHLDLKPRNVFILAARPGRPEQVKVIDFGIGQHIGEEAEEEPSLPIGSGGLGTTWAPDFNPSTLHFQESTINDPPGLRRCQGCTPEYASPEQAAHVLGLPDVVPLDGRSDLYSLGVMAYQMLTGDLPFARPVVRSDYLRLHLGGKPRRIAGARAKVPRALARFVERSLQKDREDRFADAREAYEAMERIVRPPLALRIGVGAILLVGAAFVFGRYLIGGEARAAVLASAGADLGPQNPLYMGPQQISARLAMPAEGLVDGESPLKLVRVTDDVEVPGSHVTLVGTFELQLDLGASGLGQPEGREVASVRIESKGASFKPFDVVWLGKNSWTLESVTAGGIPLVDNPRAVDPRDLNFEVALKGDGREAVEQVTARLVGGGDDVVNLRKSPDKGDRRFFRAAFGELGLLTGSVHVLVQAKDHARGTQELDIPLAIVETPLAATAVLGKRGEEGFASFVQFNGHFVLGPGCKPLLQVQPSRTADLYWRLQFGAASDDRTWNHRDAAELEPFLIDLPPEAENERLMTVELRVDEGDRVVRAESAADRGRVQYSIPFLVSAELAEFEAWLELPDPAQAGTSRRVDLVPEGTTWVDSGQLQLVVRRRGLPAMSLQLSDGQKGILNAGELQRSFPLDLPPGEPRELVIQSYRFDTTVESVADQFDKQLKFRVGVDALPPALALPDGLDGRRFVDLDSLPAVVKPKLEAGDSGAPVSVEWRLLRPSDGLSEQGTWHPGDEPSPGDKPIALHGLWGKQGGLPDGDWRLELTARDVAGNKSPSVTAEFCVALVGPKVFIDAPIRGVWTRDPEGWRVQVRASDPNGVKSATCFIKSDDKTQPPFELDPGEGLPEDRQWSGYVKIPFEWSSRNVEIEVEARDSEGKANISRLSGITMSTIHPPQPFAIRATGACGTNRAQMHLVLGNTDAQYLFGGRGDGVENAAHRDAGLRGFAETDTVLSWSVPYSSGEIDNFYLDEREVTRGDFLAFVGDPEGYAQASHWPAGSKTPDPARRADLATRLAGDTDLPVTDVTWEEASAFAHWIGRRLPSWVEFEYAVRGGPVYRPFAGFGGGAPAPGEINSKALGPGHAWVCGTSKDVTPDSLIRDLAGNVREWTATPLALTAEPQHEDSGAYFFKHRAQLLAPAGNEECQKFWVAGGSFRHDNYFFDAAAPRERGFKAEYVGFRCALSMQEVWAGLDRGSLEEVK